jgi:hypothetical protein
VVGDPARLGVGIELDDDERAAHDPAQLAERGGAVANVADR